jgi:hypothetical protein
MRINIYAHLIIIEILDEICARAQNWSTVEYCQQFLCVYLVLLCVHTLVHSAVE